MIVSLFPCRLQIRIHLSSYYTYSNDNCHQIFLLLFSRTVLPVAFPKKVRALFGLAMPYFLIACFIPKHRNGALALSKKCYSCISYLKISNGYNGNTAGVTGTTSYEIRIIFTEASTVSTAVQ